MVLTREESIEMEGGEGRRKVLCVKGRFDGLVVALDEVGMEKSLGGREDIRFH